MICFKGNRLFLSKVWGELWFTGYEKNGKTRTKATKPIRKYLINLYPHIKGVSLFGSCLLVVFMSVAFIGGFLW